MPPEQVQGGPQGALPRRPLLTGRDAVPDDHRPTALSGRAVARDGQAHREQSARTGSRSGGRRAGAGCRIHLPVLEKKPAQRPGVRRGGAARAGSQSAPACPPRRCTVRQVRLPGPRPAGRLSGGSPPQCPAPTGTDDGGASRLTNPRTRAPPGGAVAEQKCRRVSRLHLLSSVMLRRETAVRGARWSTPSSRLLLCLRPSARRRFGQQKEPI